MVDRLNFDRGRVDPSLAISASVGADLIRSEKCVTRIQVDGDNLNNRLNVLDFGGLFSGNAIEPGRRVYGRLSVSF